MTRLPSVFVSHGAPSFALEPGQAGPRLAALGRELPRPEAVLLVSPHWMTPDPMVGLAARPETVHDYGGFSTALRRVQYPAPGHPELARRTLQLLQKEGWNARGSEQRGLDHGAWVPMLHMYPDANVPMFQVSLPAKADAQAAWSFGRALAPLSSEGVLIVGSGSLTHNLFEFMYRVVGNEPYVAQFANWVKEAVISNDRDRLLRTLLEAPQARRAHPTTEHFLPLLVAAGAAPKTWEATVIDGGIAHGVLSMDGYVFGLPSSSTR